MFKRVFRKLTILEYIYELNFFSKIRKNVASKISNQEL